MSRIDELVSEFCSGGVRFNALHTIARIHRGQRITKRQLINTGKFPVYSGGVTPMGYLDKCNQPENTITVVKYGSAGFVNFIEQSFWANDVCYCLVPENKIVKKFLYYYLKSHENVIQSMATNAVPQHLPTDSLKDFPVPTPPLEVQNEIVQILDKFTELEAELEARNKQYVYYREALLNFKEYGYGVCRRNQPRTRAYLSRIDNLIANFCPNGVDFYPVSSLLEKSSNIRWMDVPDEKFTYIDLTSVDRTTHSIGEVKTIDSETAPSRAQQIVHENDVLFGTTRPTLKRYCLVPRKYHEQICSTGFCVLRPKTDVILPRFLFHIIGTNAIFAYVEANQRGASYPAISDRVLKAFDMPVPPLEIQHEIVGILDKFNALVNDMSIGLPAEINARRQQYEHYRDRLLTFEDAA